MKLELKHIIKNLNPKLFGVNKVSIYSFKKLGVGEGNINYIFKIGAKKFICRINIDKSVPNKSLDEFNSLKTVENLNIAPKAYYYHPKDKKFLYGFIILEYLEGRSFRKKKRTYTQKQIKQLVFILADLHSKKYRGLSKKNYFFQHYIKEVDHYIRIINKYNNKLEEELKEINNRIMKFLPKKEEHKFGLIHGDICPQNIIATKNGLKLIDWESLQYSDPAKDIANILIDLELNQNHLNLFLQEYRKKRIDSTILKRAQIYAILKRHNYVLWEIVRSFEIANKELPKEYLKRTTVRRHINEAKTQFRKLSKLIKIPKLNMDKLFPNLKN